MLDRKTKETYRLLQSKGFGLPQVSFAQQLIEEQTNDKHFKDCLLTCENCSLGSQYQGEKVLGDGPITSPVMIVGDYTKEDDEESGIPFSGSAGVLLTMALQALGVDRRCIYITNAVKCRCCMGPTPDNLATCKPYLEYEINRMKPKHIITLGSVALKSVTNNFEVKISEYRGSILKKGDYKIYPTWHPDYLLKKSGMEYKKASEEFIYDLKKALDIIKEENQNYKWIL